MIQDNETKDLNYCIDWLERSITEEHIKSYENSDFINIQPIGTGAYGNVVRVNQRNTNRVFALKSFNSDKQTLKEVVKELKLHRKVDDHENIIRLYGITQVETDVTLKYSLVLEYADGGTFNAVEFLHERDIIHRDLHGKNILVHQKNIKLTDFGLSKKIAEASSNGSKIFGVIPYIDPKKLDNQNYKLDKKSDVYSVGVLLWQISSGCNPFFEDDYDMILVLAILKGKREEIANGTPVKYSNLYKECWEHEPNERPNMRKIGSTLKSIISPEEINTTIDNFIEEKENYSFDEYETNSKLSKRTIDLNYELSNELNLLDYKIISTELNEGLNSELKLNENVQSISHKISKVTLDYRSSSANITEAIEVAGSNYKTIVQNQKYENSLSSTISDQVTDASIDLIEFINVDRLITFLIEKRDIEHIQQLMIKQILKIEQATGSLIKWLLKNQDKSKYIWFLGLFYYYNIVIEENSSIKAFELFSKATDDNYSIAQVYLAKCYYDRYGVNRNKDLAFYWYKKSAENESAIGKFYLGNCYEFGIGTGKNEERSFHFYKEATEGGNTIVKLNLAHCYRLGKGVKKHEIKAFKYYKGLAKQEIADAQLEVANCFYNGVGTKVDKMQAKCWYEKATNNVNIIAKKILKKYYNIKMRVEMDKSKKNKSYKILFHKSLSQLGLYYVGKLLLKSNYEKSFYYFQKAAENGCKFAQFNLGGCYQLGYGVRKDMRMSFELYKKSAELGYINAQSQLIYCYSFGFGTEINSIKAFELAKTMTEREEYRDIQYLLGQHYAYGNGVNKDEKKAFELFKKAAKENTKYLFSNKEVKINKQKDFEYSKLFGRIINCDLYSKLGYYHSMGIGTEINKIKAFELYKIAADKDHKIAQYSLGNCYDKGIGTEVDKTKAFEYYKKSADQGYVDAQFHLGYCYDKGIGTEVDKTKAYEYYVKSFIKGYSNIDLHMYYKYLQYYNTGIGTEVYKTGIFKFNRVIFQFQYNKEIGTYFCRKLTTNQRHYLYNQNQLKYGEIWPLYRDNKSAENNFLESHIHEINDKLLGNAKIIFRKIDEKRNCDAQECLTSLYEDEIQKIF
ncbi:kinase-like domain-containing protein [Rhizophagus clarus]|uniref:Kinase-like domain-containing protein n=1 Tax=Rhizophagus clarus TaxID=94130 RepID=A0A8H3KZK5_9GLOM|nr:kinase-like domain-containing protein [Rhizophagus clarus]